MRTTVLAAASLSAFLAAGCLSGSITEGTGADPGGDDDAPGADPEGGGDDDDEVCDQTVPITVTQTQKTPDMLLVVDKSGSMDETLAVGDTKMNVMKQALQIVLPAQDANIHFGLALYPADDTCGAGVTVTPIAANNALNVLAQIAPVQPDGATPTHTSLDAAKSYFASVPVNPDGRYVLLATDGLPNCNGGEAGDPSNSQSIAAAQSLANAGIPVYVIGFGDVSVADPGFLNQMASAGGTGSFFAANSPTELQAALQQISGTVTQASCNFQLATVPADQTKLGVTIDGVAVPRDPSHQIGWDYDAATNSITFYGDTCEGIQGGQGANVGVDYGCGSVIIG